MAQIKATTENCSLAIWTNKDVPFDYRFLEGSSDMLHNGHPVAKDRTLGDNIETINARLALPWEGLYERDDTQHCPIVIRLYVIEM